MTYSFKSAALSAAVAISLVTGTSAFAGGAPVATPTPTVTVPLVFSPQAVVVIARIASGAGLGNLSAVLSSAKPGSPEAQAAVVSIVTVLSQRATLPRLNPLQTAQARAAIQRIIARTGGSPALTALLGRIGR
ncbi:MAG: hypothetical protein ACT4N9_01340 [Paracoccaceae bacterium]